MAKPAHCAEMREQLHGHLDDALTPAEERSLAAHLAVCGPCREELAQLRALKKALCRMEVPADSGPTCARVFRRFRDAAPGGRPAQPSWLGRPALSFALAAAGAVLAAFLTPVIPARAPSALLPDHAEMSVLSQRHDLHVAHVERQPGQEERNSTHE